MTGKCFDIDHFAHHEIKGNREVIKNHAHNLTGSLKEAARVGEN